MHGAMQLFELVVDVRSGRRVADVGVDLAVERDADAHRFEVAVVDVGGNDCAAARHFVAHELRRNLLARRHVLHFLGDHALARVVHLREISRAAVHCRRTLLNPFVSQRHKNLQLHLPLLRGSHRPRSLSHRPCRAATQPDAEAFDPSGLTVVISGVYLQCIGLLAGHLASIEGLHETHALQIFRRDCCPSRDFDPSFRASRHVALRPRQDRHLDWHGDRLRLGQSALPGSSGREKWIAARCSIGLWNLPLRSPWLKLAGAKTRSCSATLLTADTHPARNGLTIGISSTSRSVMKFVVNGKPLATQ